MSDNILDRYVATAKRVRAAVTAGEQPNALDVLDLASFAEYAASKLEGDQ